MAKQKPTNTEEKPPKTKWKVTDTRFVGYLDILGFKDRVARESHEVIYKDLRIISEVKSLLEGLHKQRAEFKEIHIVNFSDSMIIFTQGETEGEFAFLLKAMGLLFARAIKNGIPLKGAIACGKISVNKERQIFFGQPIIDAYLLEQEVNYMGVVAHNSIDNYIKENDLKEEVTKYLFEAGTPLKCGSIVHNNIDWFYFDFLRSYTVEKALKKVEEAIKNFRASISGSPRRYVENTLKVFDERKEYLRKMK